MSRKLTADDFQKVTIQVNGATHVAYRTGRRQRRKPTLCGRKWWFECDHGTDHYCEVCQNRLTLLYTPEP